MAKKTTKAERREYIEMQRAKGEYTRPRYRTYPADMSFIDRSGNIVNQDKYGKKAVAYNVKHAEALRLNNEYDKLINTYGKDSKEVYQFEKEKLGKLRKGKPGRLEAGLAIAGILGGIFFLSSNLTSSVIGLNQSAGNILGAVLLVIGLISGFLWFRGRKK